MSLRLAIGAIIVASAAHIAVSQPVALSLGPRMGHGFTLLGINLASAEFGISGMEHGATNPGRYGSDYTYPTNAEVDDYAAMGLNIARVPFSWERMQPLMCGPLDPIELGRMDDLVAHAATRGFHILLDPHNYGYGYGHLVGSQQTPDAALADFWRRMALHYRMYPNVLFGLMNEPHDQSPQQWLSAANASIAAIRAAGATQEILVPGTFHANGASWVRQGNSSGFADHVVDPGHNMAFEVHQYLDADQSGGSTVPVSPTIGADRLAPVTAWAEANGRMLFLGEFGAGTDAASLQAMRNQLGFMQAHSDVWQGGTIWGGGPWWPKDYPWATDTSNGQISPQTRVLLEFLPGR